MEGTPEIALHLLQYGVALAQRGLHRAAALAFNSAADTSRMSPKVAAHALYKAAFQLYKAAGSSLTEDEAQRDRRRALDLLRKCYLHVRSLPSCFSIRMQIFALVERLYTQSGNYAKAGQTVDRALSTISSQNADRHGALLWWVYLRGRALSIFLSMENQFDRALQTADHCAEQCASYGDSLAATAFYAARFQMLLGNSNPRMNSSFEIDKPKAILNSFHPLNRRQIIDKATLDVAIHIFEALQHLRLGHIKTAHRHSIDPLLASYRRLREVVRSDITATGSWIWLGPKLLSTITNNIVSLVAQEDNIRRSQAAASVCLRRLRLLEDYQTDRNQLELVCRDNQITRMAALGLSVSILENGARFLMAQLEMKEAAARIKSAALLVFQDTGDRCKLQLAETSGAVDLGVLLEPTLPISSLKLRSVIMLLFAEYHILRGILPGAEAAMRFLSTLCDLPRKFDATIGQEWASDVVQSAASHLSLLTGEKRKVFGPKGVGQSDVSDGLLEQETSIQGFQNHLSYAAALLTDGVYYMRLEKVIEASQSVDRAIDVSAACRASSNQVAANALAIRSAPGLIHQVLRNEPFQDIAESMRMAQQLEDPVLMARATRQRRRLILRSEMSRKDMHSADTQLQRAHMLVISKQNGAPLILS